MLGAIGLDVALLTLLVGVSALLSWYWLHSAARRPTRTPPKPSPLNLWTKVLGGLAIGVVAGAIFALTWSALGLDRWFASYAAFILIAVAGWTIWQRTRDRRTSRATHRRSVIRCRSRSPGAQGRSGR